MGVAAATVTGIPIRVALDADGDAVLGRMSCRITAGASAIEVSASEICVTDALGGGGHRYAYGVSVPGMLDPAARVHIEPFVSVELSVWFEPIALGTTDRFATVAVLSVDGERRSVACEARVIGTPGQGTGSYPR